MRRLYGFDYRDPWSDRTSARRWHEGPAQRERQIEMTTKHTYRGGDRRELPDDVDIWSLLVVVESTISSLIKTGAPPAEVRVELTGEGDFACDSVAEAYAEVTEHQHRVETLVIRQRIKRHQYSPAIEIRFLDYLGKNLVVETRSPSRVEAVGWADTILKRLDRWLAAPVKIDPLPARPAPAQVAMSGKGEVSGAARNEQMTAAPPEKSQGWLARTWRDHTAVLLITVLGTVLAGLILVWLGASA
jgi:hypothetical protein